MRADMSPARYHEPAALVPSSLLVVLMTAPGAEACNATCKRDFARCMATQCGAGVGREACRRRCKPAAIRTLAYVVSECREDAAGMEVGRQALLHPSGRPRADHGRRVRSVRADAGPAGTLPAVWRVSGRHRVGADRPAAAPRGEPGRSGVVLEVNDSFSIDPPRH